MASTLNSVATIESVMGNTLTVEVITNNLRNGELQFYYLNKDNNNINYVKFDEFNNKLKDSLKKNNTFVITFCGISNKDNSIPEYLYLAFSGSEVSYRPFMNNNTIFLEFKFKKSGRTLEQELISLFTNNVGVFIQAF